MRSASEVILSSCLDKKSFSKKEADGVIDYYAKRKKIMFYYKCDFCNRFHISKQHDTVKKLLIIGGK